MPIHVRMAAIFALLVGAAVAPVGAGPAAEPAADAATAQAADRTALRYLKEVLWPKAYAEQDAELLNTILAEEFQLIDADGSWFGKADELKYVRENKPGYDALVFAVKRLHVFENDTAIVAGEGTVRGQDQQGPYVSTYQSTNVLIKRDGAWQAISSHVSGVKRAPAQ